MRIETINKRKQSRRFYSGGFRKAVNALFISVILNFVFLGTLQYRYMHMPKIDFYTTDGITMPVKLTPLSAPNMSSTPLLPEEVAQASAPSVVLDNL